MRYVVDRIEDDIVVLEDISNKLIIEESKTLFPKGIRDGSVVLFKNNKYILDNGFENERRKSIREKFNKLVGDKDE